MLCRQTCIEICKKFIAYPQALQTLMLTSTLSYSALSLYSSHVQPFLQTRHEAMPNTSIHVWPQLNFASLTFSSSSYFDPYSDLYCNLTIAYCIHDSSDASPLSTGQIHSSSTSCCLSSNQGLGRGDVGLNDVSMSDCAVSGHRLAGSFFRWGPYHNHSYKDFQLVARPLGEFVLPCYPAIQNILCRN